MLTFLATSIPLLTIQIDYVIQYTKPNISKTAANVYVAGYIMLIIVQYLWVLVLGSDKSTRLGSMGHFPTDHDEVAPATRYEPEFYSEKMMQSLPSSAIMGHNGRSHSKLIVYYDMCLLFDMLPI